MKIYVAKFSRAESSLELLVKKLGRLEMLTMDYHKADYFLLSGDRTEVFDFAVRCLRDNKKIIHLWAGECDSGWSTYDEWYRTFITLASCVQLCTNKYALDRVIQLCKATDKKPNAHIVGNLMLDNLELDESFIPDKPYNLVLYNPTIDRKIIEVEINRIMKILNKDKIPYIWLAPNGDMNSDLIDVWVTEKNRPRPLFLGLLKHCRKFITNSSCQYYEAPFLMDTKNIIPIGKRNAYRESKYADMSITGATNKIIKILEGLNGR
jgi:UDP-N-acetylglucosamine 2-epimerase